MKVFSFLVLFYFCGCATFEPMNKGLKPSIGQHISTAIAVLGEPLKRQSHGDKTIYAWSLSKTETITLPRTTMAPVFPYTSAASHNALSSQPAPITYHCTLFVIADENHRIVTWKYQGDHGGCACHIRKLSEHYKAM